MKNYLVVGGSSGIGQALVSELSLADRVYATYHQHHRLSEHELVSYHPLNVLEESFDLSFLPPTLDGLAYCVGAVPLKPFRHFSETDFLQDYRLQVTGAVKIIKEILPRFQTGSASSIVLFSSVAVQLGFKFHSVVSASKGAIEGLSRSLAAEFAPNIRVNVIAPSITATALTAPFLNTPEKRETNAQRHPLKRIGTVEDIASMAAFLLSEKSSWITGQVFAVDGGISSLK